MKIIVFGARGDVGSRVIAEALARDHSVTGVVRDAAQANLLPAPVTTRVADALDTDAAARLMAGHDLAISAVRPPDGREHALVPLTQSLLDAAARASVRILVVGGAASLKMPDQSGDTVLTAPGFLPEAVVPIATACQSQYDLISAGNCADWSYVCPPALLMPGDRTGQYRVGADTLLVDADGNSAISMEDFAVAIIDEAETPHHEGARFTVAH